MRGKHSPGLALSELLIVLAVIMTCLALAKPDLLNLASRYTLKAAAREVAMDLQHIRLLAVKEKKTFQVIFDSNSYQVIQLNDGIVAESRSFSPEYSGINLTNASITFDSRGTSNGNSVTLANGSGTTKVFVAPTGKVMIE